MARRCGSRFAFGRGWACGCKLGLMPSSGAILPSSVVAVPLELDLIGGEHVDVSSFLHTMPSSMKTTTLGTVSPNNFGVS